MSVFVRLICCHIMLTANSKARESVDLSLTCHPYPSFTAFAFRSSEVEHLLLDLDPYGDTDSLGVSSFSYENC